VAALKVAGAHVLVHDPMFSDEELAEFGWEPYHLGDPVDAAIVQADHPEYRGLASIDLPGAQVILDGRRVLSGNGIAVTLGSGRLSSD
jgi:UDP-N-acetyl-D-mannosaminuronate dehydrogenase